MKAEKFKLFDAASADAPALVITARLSADAGAGVVVGVQHFSPAHA